MQIKIPGVFSPFAQSVKQHLRVLQTISDDMVHKEKVGPMGEGR
jgi:hypothetical protein